MNKKIIADMTFETAAGFCLLLTFVFYCFKGWSGFLVASPVGLLSLAMLFDSEKPRKDGEKK